MSVNTHSSSDFDTVDEEDDEDAGHVMEAQEVPAHQWADFFTDFSQRFAGQSVTVEAGASYGDPSAEEAETIAQGLTLTGVSVDFKDGEEGTIQIFLGDETEDHITHVVTEPTYVWRYQDSEGEDSVLEIESADGPTTLIHL
ncbi:hypothetical protein CCAX7_16760 [Capsulimonas corticalis]|uniref:Uncharacterized protein n=1 Tax=Capsulimonas corticalis TaxID=2219043 RepID=A0A402CYU7_9BACT|nr:DUF5335 family protein [Capsulimonas corticalis]BDI29625.1 hypothetical protein CCAX7_16760 [Capsulimonas corticalis]